MIGDGPVAAKRALRIIPTTVASVVASAVFVIVIAVVARNTADGVPAPMTYRDAGDVVGDDAVIDDAGVGDDAGVMADAGFVTVDEGPDAGPEPDAGPPFVDGPPYDPALVITAAVEVAAVCAAEAMRWDPSLGGPFTLSVTLPSAVRDVVDVDAIGLRSPVLERCLERRGPHIALPGGARHNLVPQRVEARASLGTGAAIEVSDVNIVSADADAGTATAAAP